MHYDHRFREDYNEGDRSKVERYDREEATETPAESPQEEDHPTEVEDHVPWPPPNVDDFAPYVPGS